MQEKVERLPQMHRMKGWNRSFNVTKRNWFLPKKKLNFNEFSTFLIKAVFAVEKVESYAWNEPLTKSIQPVLAKNLTPTSTGQTPDYVILLWYFFAGNSQIKVIQSNFDFD